MNEGREALDLRFWRPREFTVESRGTVVDWWPQMSIRLLVCLDIFRMRWGKPCTISPVRGALGRALGRSSTTQHNVDRWGEVRAADWFPEGAVTQEDAHRIVQCMTESGFTGIGIYPHWHNHLGQQQIGVHGDVRLGSQPGYPAMWGGVSVEGSQQYVSIDEAIAQLPETR